MDYRSEASGRNGSARPEDGALLRALSSASRALSTQREPVHALWLVVAAIRSTLGIDRAGFFAYDAERRLLDRVVGVDPRGNREEGGESFTVCGHCAPLFQVARRELPYYFTDDVQRDYPHCRFRVPVRALAIVPITVGDILLGILCADNGITGRPMPEALLEPLFLFTNLAALPLFALYQRKEMERFDRVRREIHRDVLYAVTGGRIRLCDEIEILQEWPEPCPAIPIQERGDIRAVRQAVRDLALAAGMAPPRVEDFGLCASEAATNAFMHGAGGGACLEQREDRIRVRVMDHGTGIRPEDLPNATLLKGWSSRASMGLGFTLMKETADRLLLHTGCHGTTLILEMAVEPQEDGLEQYNLLLCDDL